MNPRVAVTAFVLLAICTASVFAETKLDITGQVRVRSFFDKRDFDPSATDREYNQLRARLAVAATVDSNTIAVIQLQDSRDFEDDSLAGAMSGTRANTKNLDAHQAYLQVNRIFADGFGFKAGRFEVKFGNERLFGVDDWNNVGLAFNGAMLSFERPSYIFNAFGLAGPVERREDFGHTVLIWGSVLQIQDPNVEALYYFENIDFNYPLDSLRLNRHTLALFGENTLFGITAEWNLAYQFGKKKSEHGVYAGNNYDISAHLVGVKLRRTLPLLEESQISLGIDYNSGDSPSTASREDFTAPYASQRRFGGAMGYFELRRREIDGGEGLVDIFAGLTTNITTEWSVGLVGHRFVRPYKQFYFMFDYIPGPMRISNEIGWEVDFIVTTTSVKGIHLQGGLSAFFAHESFVWLRDFDPGYYAYSQMTVDF